jgi:hypothetical protein
MIRSIITFLGSALVAAVILAPVAIANAADRNFACIRRNDYSPTLIQCDVPDDTYLPKGLSTGVTLYAAINIQASSAWAKVDACKYYRFSPGFICSAQTLFDYQGSLGGQFKQVATATWLNDHSSFAFTRVFFSHSDRALVDLFGFYISG